MTTDINWQFIPAKEPAMPETTTTRTRKSNPFTAYQKAHNFAEKVRKAAERADRLSAVAKEAADKAAELAAQQEQAEADEQEAYAALQAALADLGNVADDDA